MSEKTSTAAKASEPASRGARSESPPPAALGLVSTLLGLQQATGNRSVGHLLGGALLQPKLRIGPPGDAYEREADRIAEAVLRQGDPSPVAISAVRGGAGVQRMCADCEEELLQGKAAVGDGLVQRECHCHDEELVQRQCRCHEEEQLVQPKSDSPVPSPPAFEGRVAALQGAGRPLPTPVRSVFEPRFGHDFGAVRVHTGAAAGEAARAVGARAFTVGNDVVFGTGEWSPETAGGRRLLAHELTHVVQQTPLVARRKPLLQRSPLAGEATAEPAAPAREQPTPQPAPEPTPSAPERASEASPAEPALADPAPAQQAPAATVIVDDDAVEVGEGQMRKSDFLARLRPEVCGAAETGLAGTEHEANGCPVIDFWFGYYEGQSAERLNRDLGRFVEAAGPRPTTADEYIALIADRVRQGVTTWAQTGELSGVPGGIPLPGMNLPGLQGATAALSSLGGVFFKALPGGARDPGSPQALRSQLGAGQPLDGGTRSRMESVFGRSFAHVQVHTDGPAAALSDRLNARAFTVGEHVAFGAQQYRPGTLVGDALMAHELAHVAQQSGAAESQQPLRVGDPSYGALERDADLAAVGAMASLWGLRLPGLRLPQRATPRLSSGLRLQRCNCGKKRSTCGINVAGVHEVNHYCADYVPSDAPSCGDFPAPNLALTASGGAAGATLQWSITKGADKAAIDGASTGPSVAIKGTAKSVAKDDVTVEVTDGKCSTPHLVTVRQPSKMVATDTPTSGPTFIKTVIVYTVQDQFDTAMGAGICVDETITKCKESHAAAFTFGDAATNVDGEVMDTLSAASPAGLPAGLCIKLDQDITAGGCGPLLQNTIVFRNAGITLNRNSNCAAGDPCP
ncbi:MAG TPA: DUF4157 domain-containing protein [Thermoanaerobaculia bacterium]|jgi:hypothetical protein|nr:DUF4157 domain-containing protein [Thermoanaerobaculia bacterium]